jgi:hypothetical protein
MLVPKAAVNKDHLSMPWQDKIRCAWEIASMKSKPETKAVHDLAHCPLWSRVGRPDTAHIMASLPRSVPIGHG